MQVEWRRDKVLELLSMGNSQTEIAKILQIDLSIVRKDTAFLRQQAMTLSLDLKIALETWWVPKK
jgi:hypothetical protein